MHYNLIAKELSIAARSVQATISLLDEGNTIPFIARYRKEVTGGLDEEQLRAIQSRVLYLRKLDERKESVRTEIEAQGKLTPEIADQLDAATTLQLVEDIYLPFKKKRRTRASVAREAGLEPLADQVLEQNPQADPMLIAQSFINEEIEDVDMALAGARDIIAERIVENVVVREMARKTAARQGILHSQLSTDDADPEGQFRVYHDFQEPLRSVAPHQWLALHRGESSGSLRVSIDIPETVIVHDIAGLYLTTRPNASSEQVEAALHDGYRRLLKPAVDRDMRTELRTLATRHAIDVFATNLRNLLMQPPLKKRAVMGIDPGYRSGCKVATVDPTGMLLHTATIYPHPPQRHWQQALSQLGELLTIDQVNIIAIGNGTASRETEQLAAELIQQHLGVSYVVVSEAGASVYSASKLAREEFPDLDVSIRGAVSIARRLQDPLAELVKIDPRSVGVGLYQHDVDQKLLSESLDAVVESVVNYVGVDVNTASAALLSHVSGLSKRTAANIVVYRQANGPFTARTELHKVKGLGPKAYQQAAGFLRIPDARNRLDNTIIHPESYPATTALLEFADLNLRMADLPARLKRFGETERLEDIADVLGIGQATLEDIIDALIRPGRDPRDSLPAPILRQDVLSIDDLREGMTLKGTVRNVVDFGAFVDIGVKHDGLVHVSKMADRYVRNPHEIVGVGDVVDVMVVSVDTERGRIGLSMVL